MNIINLNIIDKSLLPNEAVNLTKVWINGINRENREVYWIISYQKSKLGKSKL